MDESHRNKIMAQAEKDIRLVREQINAIDVKMRDLRDKREKLVSERNRVSRLLSSPPTGVPQMKDDLGYDAALLAPYIVDWIAEHDEVYGGGGTKTLSLISVTNARNLRSIKNGEQRWVSLRVADRLMTAMRRQQVMSEWPLMTTPQTRNGHEGSKPFIPDPPVNIYTED